MLVERTVSRWRNDRWESRGETLVDFRSTQGYVLLGEPGSGKTTSFEGEAESDPAAFCVPARHFVGRDLQWPQCKTFFIDSLDEVRAGGGDLREPLDALLSRIEQIGRPRFRLSCRPEAWLGANDSRELSSVTAGEEVQLLRLNPLTRDDVRRILASMEIADPAGFISQAVERGLECFLANPLLLDIMARATRAGPPPVRRLDTFASACEALVEETNTKHLDAMDGVPYETDQVVRAAGRLCALLLLSAKSGWSRRGRGSDDVPPLREAGECQPLLKYALDTNLFEGSTETGRRPRHRNIAEFLAARYVDHAIQSQRLTATRALRLLQGIDGIVMPDLRGVSLWLAAMNPGVRRPLIAVDPVGLAYQGDAGGFSRRDTDRLLRALEARLEHQWEWPSPVALAALMAGPACQLLWEMLQDTDRSTTRRALVANLLLGVEATPLRGGREAASGGLDTATEIRKHLPAVVRDPTWQSPVRNRALTALIHISGEEKDAPEVFRELLRDLDDGGVLEDEDGELRAELLTYLYPRYLAAGEIWDYAERIWDDTGSSLVPRGKGKKFRKFWTEHLVVASSPAEVRTLLDTLTPRASTLTCLLAQNDVESLVMRLLARGLELFGEKVRVRDLYEWFKLVQGDYERTGLLPAHCERVARREHYPQEQNRIYDWLRDHPDIQCSLIREGVRRKASSETQLVHSVGLKFLGDKVPSGFREWCLTTAVELAPQAVLASEELVLWATMKRDEWGPPLADVLVAAAVQRTPSLRKWNERRLARARDEARRRASQANIEIRERQHAYLASIRDHLPAIEAGQGPLGVLHELGRVYLNGLQVGGPDQARQDLRFQLDCDRDLFTAVITGFRRLVGRTDLPTLRDTTRLHAQNRMSAFGAPFLAGLSEEELAGADPLQHLDDKGRGRALGFYLLSRLPTRHQPIPRIPNYSEDCRPGWYRQALRNHAQVVADAFVAVNRARVASKEPPDQHLYDLARSDEYDRVAPLAVPKMFTPFPSCCTASQLDTLRPVLWAALKYMPCDLGGVVLRRLGRKGMDRAQRVHWLSVGLFVEYEVCRPALLELLADGAEGKVRHLVHCLVPDRDPLPTKEWPCADLGALIKAVGRALSGPWNSAEHASGHFRTGDALKADELVRAWVRTLAHQVTADASDALRDLVAEPSLKHQRHLLVQARDRQASKRRSLAWKPATLRDIREALSGGPPASAADLAALVVDKLEELADRIRDGNTEDWQQYWHTDPDDPRGRKVTKPKSEHGCRKALLSDLELLLEPYKVAVQPEGVHAEERRSDIIASRDHHTVPMEIKKTDNRGLWTAVEHQLIPKYLRDPKCGGYGIFVVFWHGRDYLGVAPPDGPPPGSPEQLRTQLEALLTPEQRRTITIIVVDLSAPPGWVRA